MDYAASTWYGLEKQGTNRLIETLEKVQRLGARGILRAWKNVSLPVLEAETYLEDTRTRLDKKVAKHAVKVLTCPTTHPTRRAISYRKLQRRQLSPLQTTIGTYADRIKPSSKTILQLNPTWIKAPWITYSSRVEI